MPWGLTRAFLFMGLPSSHNTILVSFSFFWLQMSLSKPFREGVSRKKMVGVSYVYVSALRKSGGGLCAGVERWRVPANT